MKKNVQLNAIRKQFFVVALGERYNGYMEDEAVLIGEKRVKHSSYARKYIDFDHYLDRLYYFDVDEEDVAELFIWDKIVEDPNDIESTITVLLDADELFTKVKDYVLSLDLALLYYADQLLIINYVKSIVQYDLDTLARDSAGEFDNRLLAKLKKC